MEISWFGETSIRFRGREGIVAADAYRSVVGPTGRGLTADIVTFSHPDDAPPPTRGRAAPADRDGRVLRPTSLEGAFLLEGPGEYEVRNVLITGVRSFRDDERGARRGLNTCFIYELDGMHAVHLGDIGHLLTEEQVGEIGSVEVACVPVGSTLSPAQAAELVAQLDAKLVVPMPMGSDATSRPALERFLHEMSVQDPTPVARLTVTISTVPSETTVVVLESRTKG